jgi:hypothetical protein
MLWPWIAIFEVAFERMRWIDGNLDARRVLGVALGRDKDRVLDAGLFRAQGDHVLNLLVGFHEGDGAPKLRDVNRMARPEGIKERCGVRRDLCRR